MADKRVQWVKRGANAAEWTNERQAMAQRNEIPELKIISEFNWASAGSEMKQAIAEWSGNERKKS